MATISPLKRLADRRGHRSLGPQSLGPQGAFAAAILAVLVTLAVAAPPRDFVVPAISILLFIMAGLVALVASRHGYLLEQDPVSKQVTYWDVAGALTFIGICAAALVDPDQLAPLVEGVSGESN